jgi:predicted negative regulator of RcsB-dependent stress response
VARRVSRKELKQDELGEAVADAGHWLEQHWSDFFKWAAALLVGIGLIVGWRAWAAHRREASQELLASAVHSYDQARASGAPAEGELDRVAGELQTVIERGGSGTTGQLARLYRGSALFQLGRMDEAATELGSVLESKALPPTLAATAAALLVRVHLAAGREDQATALLTAAIEHPEETIPADQALLSLGRIHAAGGNADEARVAWQRIIDEFPTGGAAVEARRLLGS